MSPVRGRRLVGLPVRVGAAGQVGAVEDLVLGADLSVVLGLVVHLGDRHGFLPWVAVSLEADGVLAPSRTTILGVTELEYYVESGVRLSRLAGLVVADSPEASVVRDVLVELSSGHVTGLVLTDPRGTRHADLSRARIRWTAGRLLELSIASEPGDRLNPATEMRRVEERGGDLVLLAANVLDETAASSSERD